METAKRERLQWIFGRRSIRKYRPDPISDEEIQLLLEAAMAAPSAVGKDPWRFVVIRDPQTRKKIADFLPYGKMLAEAPVGIVICGDLEAAHDRLLGYLLLDCAAAIENLLLAAHCLGLGSCWIGIYPREPRVRFLRDLLGIPDHVIPVAVAAIGYPAEEKPPRTRYNPAYVYQERWEQPYERK